MRYSLLQVGTGDYLGEHKREIIERNDFRVNKVILVTEPEGLLDRKVGMGKQNTGPAKLTYRANIQPRWAPADERCGIRNKKGRHPPWSSYRSTRKESNLTRN